MRARVPGDMLSRRYNLGMNKMTIRIEAALIDAKIATPCLVLDREQIAKNYKNFCHKMKDIDIFYAVKANPHPDVLSLLVSENAYFDCASFQEITLVLAAGSHPSNICFGSTLKKASDIADAYKVGVRYFTFDARKSYKRSPTMHRDPVFVAVY